MDRRLSSRACSPSHLLVSLRVRTCRRRAEARPPPPHPNPFGLPSWQLNSLSASSKCCFPGDRHQPRRRQQHKRERNRRRNTRRETGGASLKTPIPPRIPTAIAVPTVGGQKTRAKMETTISTIITGARKGRALLADFTPNSTTHGLTETLRGAVAASPGGPNSACCLAT